jgi:hypothetical protein
MVDCYIFDLLKRLKDHSYRPGEVEIENLWESSKTISYTAQQEARNAIGDEHLSFLLDFFHKNPKHEDILNIFWFICIIAEKEGKKEALDLIYKIATTTKSRYLISPCLSFYTNSYSLGSIYSLEPLMKFLTHSTKSIRIGAYRVVDNSFYSGKETLFLSLLEAAKKPDEQDEIIEILIGYVQADSLPAMKKYAKSKSVYVRNSAKRCLFAIYIRQRKSVEEILDSMDLLKGGLFELLRIYDYDTRFEVFDKVIEKYRQIKNNNDN